jgi:hypothetical protein
VQYLLSHFPSGFGCLVIIILLKWYMNPYNNPPGMAPPNYGQGQYPQQQNYNQQQSFGQYGQPSQYGSSASDFLPQVIFFLLVFPSPSPFFLADARTDGKPLCNAIPEW